MAAGSKRPDIELLAGLLGGGSISSGSGKRILDDLNGILEQINKEPLGVKFRIDDTSMKDMREALNSLFDVNGGSKFADMFTRLLAATGKAGASLAEIREGVSSLDATLESLFANISKEGSTSAGAVQELKETFLTLRDVVNDLSTALVNVGGSSGGNVMETIGASAATALGDFKQLSKEIDNFIDLSNITNKQMAEFGVTMQDFLVANDKLSGFSFDRVKTDAGLARKTGELRELIAVYERLALAANASGASFNMGAFEELKKALSVKPISVAEQLGSGNGGDYLKDLIAGADGQLNELKAKFQEVFSLEYISPENAVVSGFFDNIQKNFDAAIAHVKAGIEGLQGVIPQVAASATTVGGGSAKSSGPQMPVKVQSYAVTHAASIMSGLGMDAEAIKTATAGLEKMNISVRTVRQEFGRTKKHAEDVVSLMISGTDEQNRQVTLLGALNKKTGQLKMDTKSIVTNYTVAGVTLKDQQKEMKAVFGELKKAQEQTAAAYKEMGVLDRLNQTGTPEYTRAEENYAASQQYLATLEARVQAYAQIRGFQKLLEQSEKNYQALIKQTNVDIDKRVARTQQQTSNKTIKNLEEVDKLLSRLSRNKIKWSDATKFDIDDENSAKIAKLEKRLNDLRIALKDGNITWKKYAEEMSEARAEYIEISEAIEGTRKAQGKLNEKSDEGAEKATKNAAAVVSYTEVLRKAKSEMDKAYESAKNIDDVMTQLRIVTEDTTKAYDEYTERVIDSSKKVGSSITDLMSSTTEYARLGYNLEESTILAEYTAMAKNVGDVDIATVQSAVTAVLKAYNINADEISAVLDKMVLVANKFPVSTGELAEGMNNAAAVLSSSGNTFEESIALMTAANTVIQNMSKAATGLRTISARIRNTKSELDDLGEAMTEADYDNLVKSLSKFSVSLTDANGEFRSTYDIISDIAAIWKDLTSMEQAGIAETLAGTRQQAIFYSMIEQFGEARGAMEAMAQSAGSLEQANAVYLESMTAHASKLQAALDALSESLIDEGFVSGAMDVLTTLLELLREIVEVINWFGGASFAVPVGLAAIFGTEAKWESVSKWLNKTVEAMSKAEGKTSLLTVATGKLGSGLSKLMAAVPGWGKIALAAIAVVSAAVVTFTHQSQKAREELSNTIAEFNEFSGEASSNISTLNALGEEFDRLSYGVSEYGENISLSTDDYERYQEIVSQVLDISPSLIAGYNAEGEAIANKNGLIEESIRLTKEEQKLKAWELTRFSNIKTASGSHKDAIGEIKESYREESGVIREALASIAAESLASRGSYISANKLSNAITSSDISDEDLIDWFLGSGGSIRAGDYGGTPFSLDYVFAGENGQRLLAKAKQYVDDLQTGVSVLRNKLDGASSEMRSILLAVPVAMDEYWELSADQRNLLNEYINSIDVTSERTDAEWNDVVNEIQNVTSEIKNSGGLLGYLDHLAYGKDKQGKSLTLDQYVDGVKRFRHELAGLERESSTGSVIAGVIGSSFDEKSKEIAEAIAHLKNILGDEFEGMIGDLSVDDILLTYQISASPNSLTIDELREKLELIKLSADFDGVLDFTTLKAGFDKIVGEANNLGSAMKKAEAGTKLTEQELHNLILEYPDLAKANISAAKTAEEQYTILNSLMEGYSAQFREMIHSQLDAIKKEMDALVEVKKFIDEHILNKHHMVLDDLYLNLYEDGWGPNGALGVANEILPYLQSTFAKIGKTVELAVDYDTGDIGFTIDGVPVQEWVSTQDEEFQNAHKELKSKLDIDFGDFFNFESGSTSNGAVEKYVAELDELYLATKKLTAAQDERARLEAAIERSQDVGDKIVLTSQLAKAIEKEAVAQARLNKAREEQINAKVEDLRAKGFVIDYDASTGHLVIQNMERLNELKGDSVEKQNELRKATEEEIKAVEGLADAQKEGIKTMDAYASSAADTREKMHALLDDTVSKANELVDGLESAYKTMSEAAVEYAQNGFLSVDSLQAILDMGPKYLSMLKDENGQLSINEQALQDVIAAKVEDMAADTALAYSRKILLAVEQNDVETLEALTKVHIDSSGATWDLAYANIGLAKSLATVNNMDTSFADDAVKSLDNMRAVTDTAKNGIKKYFSSLKDGYISQAEGLEQVLDLTKDLIKWELEQQVEALEKEKEAYQEIVDRKKEILELTKNESDRNDDLADKLSEIAKLQSRIDQLSLDDSREAQAQKRQLEEELAEKQKELEKEQNDFAYEAKVEVLDKEAEAFADAKDNEIEDLEQALNSEEKLYQAAIARIDAGWESLKDSLISWNYEYGSTLQSELEAAWSAAEEAVLRYGNTVNDVIQAGSFKAALTGVSGNTDLGKSSGESGTVVSGANKVALAQATADQMRKNSLAWLTAGADLTANTQAKLDQANLDIAGAFESASGEDIYRKSGAWYRENGERMYELSRDEIGNAIVSAMKANSAAWSAANNDKERQRYEDYNKELAARYSSFLGNTPVLGSDGVWRVNGDPLYNIKRHHTGGVAGGSPTLKQDEVLAILKKGEPVLSEEHEKGLYRIVDFAQVLSERLGKFVDGDAFRSLVMGAPLTSPRPAMPDVLQGAATSTNFAPVVTVQVNHSGDLKDSDAKHFGSIAAESVLKELNDAFNRRGVRTGSSLGRGALKN